MVGNATVLPVRLTGWPTTMMLGSAFRLIGRGAPISGLPSAATKASRTKMPRGPLMRRIPRPRYTARSFASDEAGAPVAADTGDAGA